MDTCINICIIYSTKEITKLIIPNKGHYIGIPYSKLLYTFVISPLVICNGFYNTGVITTRYWQFLRYLCYPRSKELTYYGDCSIYHNKDCSNTLLKHDYFYTLQKITYMYFKYYFLHGIYLLINKRSVLCVIEKEVINCFKSTTFLFLQNVLQRFFMCKLHNISPVNMYLITSLCSHCILFENTHRVKHINTMMISNMIISITDNYYKLYKNKLTFILLVLTFSKNKYIKIPTLILSIINGLQEYKHTKSIIPTCFTDETPIMSIPWHPFL